MELEGSLPFTQNVSVVPAVTKGYRFLQWWYIPTARAGPQLVVVAEIGLSVSLKLNLLSARYPLN
jgi:hypothetical protein